MHTTKSLKKIISYFHTTKKISKNKYENAFLALITSLLKLWELDQYFKKYPKNIFFLVSEIMNLYVKLIPDIKKVYIYILTLERLSFTR